MYRSSYHLTVDPKGSGHTASNRITKRYPYRVIWSHRMTTNEKVARRKLSLLELAKELNNVSKACKLIGYSRQQSTKFAVITRPMAPRACSINCPVVKGLIPIGLRPRLNRPSSITPSPDQPMARCGSSKNSLCRASMSVPVACVAYGNGTTCSPNTTACCA